LSNKGIGVAEVREQIACFQRIIAHPKGERRQAIGDALIVFGMRYITFLSEGEKLAPPESAGLFNEVSGESLDLLLEWLAGETLSNRADEPERRAVVAHELMERNEALVRIAAISLLKLPVGHPLREPEKIHAALLRRADSCEHERDWENLVLTLSDLLTSDLLTEQEGVAIEARLLALPEAEIGKELRVRVLGNAGLWRLGRAVAAREDNPPLQEIHLAAARQRIELLRVLDDSLKTRFQIAWSLEEAGQRAEAADLFQSVAESRGRMYKEAAWIEGMIRLALGQGKRAAEALELVVPDQERDYLAALGDDADPGEWENYAKNSVNLSFAHALEGRWADALAVIERIKSARVRHAAKLRRTPGGRKLLKLEAALAGARRGAAGVPDEKIDARLDPLGARIQRETRLLEKYRAGRPALAASTLAPPSIAEVAASLAPDEAVISLGSGFPGLMAMVITAQDRDTPTASTIFTELPQERVLGLMGEVSGDTPTGWLLELIALDPVDPEPALLGMLENADRELGPRLRALLPPQVRRVHIIPHRVLHVIPFWALPSLNGLDVRVASSLAEWHDARREAPKLSRRTTCIGDPGENLPFARIEAGAVHGTLAAHGWRSRLIAGAQATEGRVRRETRGAGLLHFAGHGFAKGSHPLLSSLLLHPDAKWQWPRRGDPLQRLARAAKTWHEIDGGRYAETPRGRLIEWTDESGAAVERRLEHALSGTLWTRYDDGKAFMCAELWSAGDLLFEGGLERCALAFLGACESGRPPLCFGVDELVWLPSSLRIVGVGTIVCTLWAIAELPALLFSRLFYRHLTRAAAGRLDVAGIVGACRAELAALTADEAAGMLREIEATLTDARGRKLLREARKDVEQIEGRPFAHPYHWAAFHVVGCETLRLGRASAPSKPGRKTRRAPRRRRRIGHARRARLE
jgi:tetratricopeptide (TPR) repeat protein